MSEPLKAGVYRVYDCTGGTSFIGYTYNLRGILKRYRFELGLNSCTVKPLQAMYNAAGGKVQMEVLEELPCNADDCDSAAVLSDAVKRWQNSLEQQGEQVKIIML